MPNACLYFQVHQPFRINRFTFFDIGYNQDYFNHSFNKEILQRATVNSYLKTNKLLLDLIEKHPADFKVAFSISGTALDQFESYLPEVLESFQQLNQTGNVEFLGETYYHSLSFIYSEKEFLRQVDMHADKIKETFGKRPVTFRNTELVFSNGLTELLKKHKFKAILSEGVKWYLNDRSPNVLFKSPNSELAVLLKNYTRSDDIAFRFSDIHWHEFPLSPEKYNEWMTGEDGDVVNLFMDYETFGEHHKESTGIFNFLRDFSTLFMSNGQKFVLPSEMVKNKKAKEVYNVPFPISWADSERDLSAWNGNSLQKEALKRIYSMEKLVLSTKNKDTLDTWGKLQTSDHFYYMSTKHSADRAVHDYFSHFDSPYDAYIYYMNILTDFENRLK